MPCWRKANKFSLKYTHCDQQHPFLSHFPPPRTTPPHTAHTNAETDLETDQLKKCSAGCERVHFSACSQGRRWPDGELTGWLARLKSSFNVAPHCGQGPYIRTVARTKASKDVARGGGKRGCASPCGFRAPEAREGQNSGGSNRNPHRRHELCAETDKKARQGSRDPSDHLGPPKKAGPL